MPRICPALPNRVLFAQLCVLLMLAPSCSKSPTHPPAAAAPANLSAVLPNSVLHPIDPSRFSALRCATGLVEGIEAMVCEYGSQEAVALGKRAGEEWIGQAATGAVLDKGRVVVALADRSHADPNGRTIQKLTSAFRR